MPFLFSFQGCYARFWSIWGIHQSLSWSASAYAERYLLSTNGIIWQHIELSSQSAHSQLLGEHLHDTYLRIYLLLLLPYPEPLQLLQLHLSHPLQLNQGWPFPFQNIESYAAHCRSSLLLRASPLSRSQLLVLIKSRLSPLRPSTLPSWGKFSIIWVLYHLLSTPFLSHKSHHRPLLLYIRLCFLRTWLQERQRQLSHHPHIILQPPSDHFHSFFYIYFLYVFRLCFPYFSSFWNPMLLILYTGINCITCSLFVLSLNEVIQIYHFFYHS